MKSRSSVLLGLLVLLALAGCGNEGSPPAAVEYDIVASAPRFVVPSAALPPEISPKASNNNVDIAFYDGRLFLAWRTAPSHFASTETEMFIMSSSDGGEHWAFENRIALGADVREPRLLSFGGQLQLFFFEAGTNPASFEPKRIWRTRRLAVASWSPTEIFLDQPQVPWDLKARNGRAYLTSYQGDHYGAGAVSDIRVLFRSSSDGESFTPVDGNDDVYRGGVSEVAFEFDVAGDLWAVTRNEDGDGSGFGSHVCHAPAAHLAQWDCSHASPERYDSPDMFRHGDDIYLVARRDIGGPFDQGRSDLSFLEQKFQYLVDYSFRPKRTALYRIDRENYAVEHLFDLPGDGDTAFPSVQQTGEHSFLLANYTSPLDQPDITWLEGQNSARGTQLYLLDLTFVPRPVGVATPTPTATQPLPATPTPTPRGGEAPLRVAVAPVIAAPGEPLTVAWPEGVDVEGNISFDAGLSFGPETTSIDVPDGERVLRGTGFVRSGDVFVPLSGEVVRATTLGVTGLRKFTLVEPMDATAQGVIRTVIPAFYWGATDATLSLATDPTGKANLAWTRVTTAAMSVALDGAFTTDAVDFEVELSGGGGTPSGELVGLVDAVFTGKVTETGFASPITMDARIVVRDVVNVLQKLGGFPAEQALQFVAGIFGFDPATPPETAPFRGTLIVQ